MIQLVSSAWGFWMVGSGLAAWDHVILMGGVLGRGLCCIGICGGDAAVAWCGAQICIGTTSSGQVWRWSAEVVLPGWGGVD